jgi:hypothetical protein
MIGAATEPFFCNISRWELGTEYKTASIMLHMADIVMANPTAPQSWMSKVSTS